MTDYSGMTADELVAIGFDAMNEAEAAHYVSLLGNGTLHIKSQTGTTFALNGAQARIHADFKLGVAAACFTAALATGTEFEYDDDEDDEAGDDADAEDPGVMGDDPPKD
jgi:hypothetical protein